MIEVSINIFDLGRQRAQVLATLTPLELIETILQEFHEELPYLSGFPNDYELRVANGDAGLDDRLPLNRQISNRASLVLAERAVELPRGGRQMTRAAYLREQSRGSVYRLRWQPAIIGRPGSNLADNDLLAVNLAPYRNGDYVSRRQARITEEDGQFCIENLSPSNSVTIMDEKGNRTLIDLGRHRLNSGDVIRIDASDIHLLFLKRVV